MGTWAEALDHSSPTALCSHDGALSLPLIAWAWLVAPIDPATHKHKCPSLDVCLPQAAGWGGGTEVPGDTPGPGGGRHERGFGNSPFPWPPHPGLKGEEGPVAAFLPCTCSRPPTHLCGSSLPFLQAEYRLWWASKSLRCPGCCLPHLPLTRGSASLPVICLRGPLSEEPSQVAERPLLLVCHHGSMMTGPDYALLTLCLDPRIILSAPANSILSAPAKHRGGGGTLVFPLGYPTMV